MESLRSFSLSYVIWYTVFHIIPSSRKNAFGRLQDMDKIAEAIAMLVKDVDANKEAAMKIVKELTDKYPIY